MENLATVVYIPAMHPAQAPDNIPEDVKYIDPGLEKSSHRKSILLPNLPFNVKEAAGVLRELLDIGASFGSDGDLKLFAGPNSQKNGWLEKEDSYKLTLAEKNALKDFENHGNITKTTPENQSSNYIPLNPEDLQNAQKALLLAWNLEEHLIEISGLEKRFSEVSVNLKEAFSEYEIFDPKFEEDITQEAALAAEEFLESLYEAPEQSTFLPGYGLPTPSWRIILDASAAFLPEEAILLSFSDEIYDFLHERGMLQPLPEDLVEKIQEWDTNLLEKLLWANAPLWRILGYTRLPESRPWLLKRYDMLVARNKQ